MGGSVSYQYRTLEPLHGFLSASDLANMSTLEQELKDCAAKHKETVESFAKFNANCSLDRVAPVTYELDGLRSDPAHFLEILNSLFGKLQKEAIVGADVVWRTTETELSDVNGEYIMELYSRNVVIFQVTSVPTQHYKNFH